MDEAKENANKALQTYYTARAYYESVQDVETHPKYIPACGDSSHGLTMCYPDELSKQTNEYWKRWHEIRLSKCDDYEIINGIKNYCIITNFFWCQLHAHMYGEIRDSDSNSDNTPNCDDCTDGSDDCPNASAH